MGEAFNAVRHVGEGKICGGGLGKLWAAQKSMRSHFVGAATEGCIETGKIRFISLILPLEFLIIRPVKRHCKTI